MPKTNPIQLSRCSLTSTRSKNSSDLAKANVLSLVNSICSISCILIAASLAGLSEYLVPFWCTSANYPHVKVLPPSQEYFGNHGPKEPSDTRNHSPASGLFQIAITTLFPSRNLTSNVLMNSVICPGRYTLAHSHTLIFPARILRYT